MSPKLKVEVVPITDVPKDDLIVTRKQPVVLVVDDEKVIADTLSIILSKNGFTAITAYDGPSALILANEVVPDLLLSDVVMPRMSGIDLAITITQTFPTCKILLFSGQAATIDLLERARTMGHNFTTLTKPVHPTDMLRRISECLAPSGTLNPQASSIDAATGAPVLAN